MNTLLVDPTELVDQIHCTPTKVVLFITGGGLEVLSLLTKRGGGSATLLSAHVPYDPQETIELIGSKPEKLVSEETTRTMAVVAYQKAVALSKGAYPVIGVAVSSVLQKVPEERLGRQHVIYAALQTEDKTVSVVCEIPPSDMEAVRIRTREEDLAAMLTLDLIAEGCGLNKRVRFLPDEKTFEDECTSFKRSTIHSKYFKGLYDGTVKSLSWNIIDGVPCGTSSAEWIGMPLDVFKSNNSASSYILPGSFNPFHAGHDEIASMMNKMMQTNVDFELSIHNVDKPPLDILTIEERLRTFTMKYARVWLTDAPTFVQKSRIFPKKAFVIGADTAKRICDPKYAGDIAAVCDEFKKNGTRFFVFGRVVDGVENPGLTDLPAEFCNLAFQVAHQGQYADLSSTKIRHQQNHRKEDVGTSPAPVSPGMEGSKTQYQSYKETDCKEQTRTKKESKWQQ